MLDNRASLSAIRNLHTSSVHRHQTGRTPPRRSRLTIGRGISVFIKWGN